MQFHQKDEDIRGKRWNFQDKNNTISLFEIKKGFSRGGQYHKNDVMHILLSGKVEYRKENINTKKEDVSILESYSVICLPANNSDLITALEDSVMIGVYKNESEKTFYQKHRDIVKQKISTNS